MCLTLCQQKRVLTLHLRSGLDLNYCNDRQQGVRKTTARGFFALSQHLVSGHRHWNPPSHHRLAQLSAGFGFRWLRRLYAFWIALHLTGQASRRPHRYAEIAFAVARTDWPPFLRVKQDRGKKGQNGKEKTFKCKSVRLRQS